MTREDAQLHVAVGDLLQASSVTFYEALTVVHLARHRDTLDAVIYDRLIRLHDAPQTTDGARGILQPFLAGHARRLDAQQALGRRTIVLKDSGKTARTAVGSQLILALSERRASGYKWEIARLDEGLQCARRADSADLPNDAVFELVVAAAGVFAVELVEEAAVKHRHARRKQFALRVIGE